jgi:MFS family permease
VAAGIRKDLTLLRQRRFALLLTTRTVSTLGASFAPVALAFGVLGLPDATPTTLSVVLAAEALPLVAFLLVGGVIADRLPRWKVMVAGDTGNAVAYAAAAAMLITGWAPVWALVLAAAASGIATATLFPAMTGIIPDVVPADRLQTGNAVLGFGTNVARVTGLVASGAAVVLLGGGWALAVSAGLFAGAAVITTGLRDPAAVRPEASHSVIQDLREGWREFASRQWLWVVVLQFSVLVMAVQAAHGVLGPVVAKQSLGGAPAWSAVLAGEAVGMIAGVTVALRLRPRRPILVATVLTGPAALPYLLLGLGTPLWTVVVGAFVQGVCFDVFGVLWQTTMQREIPPAALSRVSSYDALGSLMFGPIGLLLAGPAAVLVGPQPALVGCAVIVMLTTLAALAAPGVRNLRAPEPARAEAAEAPAPPPTVVP